MGWANLVRNCTIIVELEPWAPTKEPLTLFGNEHAQTLLLNGEEGNFLSVEARPPMSSMYLK